MKRIDAGQTSSRSEAILRFLLLAISFALIVSGCLPLLSKAFADSSDTISVKLDASQIQPREPTRTLGKTWKPR